MKIDFVITWVDGTDPEWLAKKSRYSEAKTNYRESKTAERFRDYGTLRYLLRSIEKYAPWVNHVFLITDDQRPEWLKNTARLTVVDHRDFLQKKDLPVFNSNAIELNMDKIPGLAEHFVYFNDDIILNRPVKPIDFFDVDGMPRDTRVYLSLQPKEDFDSIQFTNIKLINRDVIKGQWPLNKKGLLAVGYGHSLFHNILQMRRRWVIGYYNPHGSFSFTKRDFARARELWTQEFIQTSGHRFREQNEISLWLICYLRMELGEFSPQKISFNQYYTIKDGKLIQKDLQKSSHKILCINDTETDNYVANITKLNQALAEKFPTKSIFER
ncbi:stealth family protein [Ligilactobacillus saerimneri]|uniref:stealth family protein n=1 Tax=Ligilactobacillus saerimneri TaxID=228229 RepID=UPI003F22089D